MHTEHAHWVFGNSLMSHLLDAAWHCLQAEKKESDLCVRVYVCTCTYLKTLIPPDKLWHDASMNCSRHVIPSSHKAASLYPAVISMLAKICLLN